MPSGAVQKAQENGSLLPGAVVQAHGKGRDRDSWGSAITEYWMEWVFTGTVLVGGGLMLIMLLKT